jgi:hypothetical protein
MDHLSGADQLHQLINKQTRERQEKIPTKNKNTNTDVRSVVLDKKTSWAQHIMSKNL